MPNCHENEHLKWWDHPTSPTTPLSQYIDTPQQSAEFNSIQGAVKEEDKLLSQHPNHQRKSQEAKPTLAEMIKEATISEDFTFPTITDNNSLYRLHFPSFNTSSLWHVSPTLSNLSDSKQLPEGGQEFTLEQKTHQRRSFSSVEGSRRAENLSRELEFSHRGHPNFNGDDEKSEFGGDEEKMDMLWEDFNDEPRRPSSDKREGERPKARFSDSEIPYEPDADAREMADLCCVQALKMSKSGSMIHHRRRSLLVILKVLKKLFLIQNSHSPTTRQV